MAVPQNPNVYMETVEETEDKDKKSDKARNTRILCPNGWK